ALKTVDCRVEQYPLREENGFELTWEFIDSLRQDLGIVFLCNPNNPTGRLIPRELMEKIMEKCRELGILLAVDECFMDFIEDFKEYTMLGAVESCKELFILKAFTKNYAMPGLRLGYCLCSDEALLADMERMGQPWSVSLPAQLAGVRALKEKEYLEKVASLILEEKEYLLGELENLNIKTYPPAANYILLRLSDIETREQSQRFKEALLEKGIIIRDCSNYRGLGPGYYRIAVKDRRANEKLIKALKNWGK
ncbi:MAG: aminotransferase class I/II-fold pyridoxal phosphate-dependent enzyme, partial [Anaerovorax sp.]